MNDAGRAERTRFKSSLDFAGALHMFAEKIPDIAFEPADYSYGRFNETAERIGARFQAYKKYPIKLRLQMMADDISDRFETDNVMGDDMPGKGAILKALKQMLKFKDSLALYKEFYKQNGIQKMFVMPAKKTLEWADAFPFIYIRAAFEGLREIGAVRHLVIDEMQDYTPIQHAALNQIFNCRKTVLGDFGQFLNPNHLHTLEDLKKIYAGAEYDGSLLYIACTRAMHRLTLLYEGEASSLIGSAL